MMTAQITYRRTKNGEWVAYGPADALRAGRVTVTKQDGSTKTETILPVGKSFDVDGRAMAYGYLAAGVSSSDWQSPRQGGCPTDGNCSSFLNAPPCWQCGT